MFNYFKITYGRKYNLKNNLKGLLTKVHGSIWSVWRQYYFKSRPNMRKFYILISAKLYSYYNVVQRHCNIKFVKFVTEPPQKHPPCIFSFSLTLKLKHFVTIITLKQVLGSNKLNTDFSVVNYITFSKVSFFSHTANILVKCWFYKCFIVMLECNLNQNCLMMTMLFFN